MILRLVLVLAALTAARPADACPAPRLDDDPAAAALTKAGGEVDAAGGLWIMQPRGSVPAVKLRSQGSELAGKLEWIAPGLSVLRPPVEGDIDLVDAKGNVLVSVQSPQQARKLPAALRIKRATSNARPLKRVTRRAGTLASETTIELATAVPADALAVVLFEVQRHGRVGRAWQTGVNGTSIKITTYSSKGCGGYNAPGPTFIGDRIAVAYVDALGRLSPPSKPITVAPAKRAP